MKKSLLIFMSWILLAAGVLFGASLNSSELPKQDALRKTAEKIASIWADENITSSALSLTSFQIKLFPNVSNSDFSAFNESRLKQEFKEVEDEIFPKVPVQTTVRRFNIEALKIAGETVSSDGFCYATKNTSGRKSVQKGLESVIEKLSIDSKTGLVVISHATVKLDDSKRNVNQFLYINTKTGKSVLLFVREGSM